MEEQPWFRSSPSPYGILSPCVLQSDSPQFWPVIGRTEPWKLGLPQKLPVLASALWAAGALHPVLCSLPSLQLLPAPSPGVPAFWKRGPQTLSSNVCSSWRRGLARGRRMGHKGAPSLPAVGRHLPVIRRIFPELRAVNLTVRVLGAVGSAVKKPQGRFLPWQVGIAKLSWDYGEEACCFLPPAGP